MKGNQQESLYGTLRRFDQGPNRRYYDMGRMLRHYYKHACLFKKGNRYIKIMLDTLFSERRYSNTIYCKKYSVCSDILK
jgi:hypothetical protein